jgi:glycosyltransferase involved in cell wall biosynthesis
MNGGLSSVVAGRHLHLGYTAWNNASRAYRSGKTALDWRYATCVDYVGYKGAGLPIEQLHSEGQRILRVGAEPAPPGSSRLLRALSLPRWLKACLRESRVDDATLIVAHSLAALPAAVLLARRHHLPLLYDAHELETERAGWSKQIRLIAKAVESRLIRKCDHVILVNDTIRDWYLDAYPGIDASVVRNVPVAPAVIGRSKLRETLNLPSDVLVYVYCGALGADRGLVELIEAFRDLGPDRHFVMIGYGHGKDALISQARGLGNIHFHDAVPQSELVTLLSGADVGIVVLRTDSLSYEYAMPNKLFEYAAAGLGVITGKGPELERFAREYPASKSADLTNASLRAAITAWSRDELDRLRPAIAAYTPPSWQTEQHRLIAAFDLAIENGRLRWI